MTTRTKRANSKKVLFDIGGTLGVLMLSDCELVKDLRCTFSSRESFRDAFKYIENVIYANYLPDYVTKFLEKTNSGKFDSDTVKKRKNIVLKVKRFIGMLECEIFGKELKKRA
jgi:hypothetical protein